MLASTTPADNFVKALLLYSMCLALGLPHVLKHVTILVMEQLQR